jgi:hypothetical protein
MMSNEKNNGSKCKGALLGDLIFVFLKNVV